MNKILAINGKYYAGDIPASGKRSEATPIKSRNDLNAILCDIFSRVVNGEMELKRLEIFDAKGEQNDQ
ncbi:hypothetical protein SBF1_50050 [Candidatus Desulfosporosinus infrequens]|uniref:Uncharacterized protein n=1 Tax=Candidatus Desulfosporosinus infrequens TaxID=2043169 RepID=A0A2U3LH79_9FIRM|nr:hypothetical protein SBF1_50050 [Candidatus Desulfosporosinus infrequens]